MREQKKILSIKYSKHIFPNVGLNAVIFMLGQMEEKEQSKNQKIEEY